MFGVSINGKHGLQALTAAAASIFAIAQQAAGAGILPPKVTAAVVVIGTVVAAFSNKPGTPKTD